MNSQSENKQHAVDVKPESNYQSNVHTLHVHVHVGSITCIQYNNPYCTV